MTSSEYFAEEQPRQHGKKVYGALVSIAMVALVCWVGALQWKDRSAVASITVKGERIIPVDEVIRLANIQRNTGMYNIDLTTVGQNIRQNYFVKNVIVQRDAPSTIHIEIEERTPIALVSLQGKNDLLYLDDEGYILPHVATKAIFDVPVITGVDSLVTVGQRTTQRDLWGALDVLHAARDVSDEIFHMISEIRIHDGHDIVLYSSDTGVPIIFGRGDAVKKMVKLDAFWKKFIEGEGTQNIQYIDLRFDDQVIVANKKQSS